MGKEYWDNRGEGLRGQGAYPITENKLWDISKAPSQRRQRRSKLADPAYTKPGRDTTPHVVNDYTTQREPTHNPNVTNHERVVRQRTHHD